jgi:hypothetical protein
MKTESEQHIRMLSYGPIAAIRALNLLKTYFEIMVTLLFASHFPNRTIVSPSQVVGGLYPPKIGTKNQSQMLMQPTAERFPKSVTE